MNTKQYLTAAENALKARRYGGTGDGVFPLRSVITSPLPSESGFKDLAMPVLLLRPGTHTPDPEHGAQPDYVQQQIEAAVITARRGSRFGTYPLMGAGRKSADSATGRGTLDIETEIVRGILAMPFPIQVAPTTAAIPDADERRGYMVTRIYTFEIWATTYPTHEAVERLSGSVAATTVTIDFDPPDGTDDLLGYVCRRVAGDRPILTSSEGDAVPVVGTGATDNPGAGTWTYCVFVEYADPGGAIALHTSDVRFVTVEVP